jgi:hypothetical protein
LKSSEKVTPVVGSAISGLPVFVDVPAPVSQAASANTAIPITPVNALRFMNVSPLPEAGPAMSRALLIHPAIELHQRRFVLVPSSSPLLVPLVA